MTRHENKFALAHIHPLGGPDPRQHLLTITLTGPTKTRHQLAGLCQAEMHEPHAGLPQESYLQTTTHGRVNSEGLSFSAVASVA